MPPINKIYPPFYGGESEQVDELILDTQCREMLNCVPDVVTGTERRNGTRYVADLLAKSFHTYDRGEGDEKYIFVYQDDNTDPIRVFDYTGTEYVVNYTLSALDTHTYLSGSLRGLTIQDRTFLLNTDKVVTQTTNTAPATEFTRTAYYWLSRSSNDTNNKYRYAVYLDEVAYSVTDSTSDTAATALAALVNAVTGFEAEAIGSVLKIWKTDGSDFTFSWWDSWGSQASKGWKGKVNKLSDLPADMTWDGVVVKITGNDTNEFTDYFVKSEDGVWIETRDPNDLRGSFVDMPIRIDRLASGEFEVASLVWEEPTIGDENTNPTPSFVDNKIAFMVFYKNRLGFATGDSVVLSQEGGYYAFYSKTALEVVDTDPIDVVVNSNEASKVYYIRPFQRSLYIFTKDAQFELVYQGVFSPNTVSVDLVSDYPMDVSVAPIVAGNSLYFISKTAENRSQLREYIKNEDSLVVKGTDVTVQRPTLLPKLHKLVGAPALGITFMYSQDTKSRLYLFKTVDSSDRRIQTALMQWTFSFDIEDIFVFDTDVYLLNGTKLLKMPILPDTSLLCEDQVDNTEDRTAYVSSITMAKWYPKLVELKTPVDNVQIKKVTIFGTGTIDVAVYRESYNHTTTRLYSSGSTKDMSGSVAGRADDTVITIKSNNNEQFRITSIALNGTYRGSSRELK